MPSTTQEALKSRLVERLRTISRGAPSPLGFGRSAPVSAPAMILLAVLPRNELALAEAAVRAGADAIALRLCGAVTDLLKETGDFAAEEAAIRETLAVLGDKTSVGIIVGSNGTLAPDQLAQIGGLGIDFLATYPHLTPAAFLELSDVGRVAILDQQGGNVVRGINDLSLQAVLVRTERPNDSPADMTVLDVATFRAAADSIHRPIVAFPSWKVVAADLEILKNAGIEGAALVGPSPDATAEQIEDEVGPFREVVARLGKPTGRRIALAEPAVILPRVAATIEVGEGEESDEDDE